MAAPTLLFGLRVFWEKLICKNAIGRYVPIVFLLYKSNVIRKGPEDLRIYHQYEFLNEDEGQL